MNANDNPNSPGVERLRSQLADVMTINSVTVLREPPDAISFRGRLLTDDVDRAFDVIYSRFQGLGFTPILRHNDGQDVVTAIAGPVAVKESDPRINLVLFLLTVVTTFLAGALYGETFDILGGILF